MAVVTAKGVIAESLGVLARQARWLLGTGVAVVVVQVAFQWVMRHVLPPRWSIGAVATGLTFGGLALSYLVNAFGMRKALEDEGMVMAGTPLRLGHYVLARLVFLLGSGVGAVLLIVPGAVIFTSWVVAANLVLARGLSIGEALDFSINLTRGHRLSILGGWFGLAVMLGLPYGALVWAAGGYLQFARIPFASLFGVARLMLGLAMVIGPLAWSIATYRLVTGSHNALAEVFA